MPFVSEAQRRWGHTEAGEKALGGPAAVREWDQATKGHSLPERKSMKAPKHGFTHSEIRHHHDGSHTVTHHHIQPEKTVEHAVPDLAGAKDSLEQHIGEGANPPAGAAPAEPMGGGIPGAA